MPQSNRQVSDEAARRRPTITDIARQAGLSVATVDRVLNARASVRPETARKVRAAAHALGYHATHLIDLRLEAKQPRWRLGFMLQKPDQSFYRELGATIERAAQACTEARLSTRIVYLEHASPQEVAGALRDMAREVDALALVSMDHPTVTTALAEIGKPAFTLLSDGAEGVRAAYIGVDNYKAGRVAAWCVRHGARRPGKVALFLGNHRYQGHQLREGGFRSWFAEKAPEFELLDTQINLDDSALAHEAMLDLLRRHPDLVGVGVMGGGMEGIVAAMRSELPASALAAVCNEATPISRSALAEGYLTAVIATPVEQLAQRSVAAMLAQLGAAPPPRRREIIAFEIVLAESL